MQYLVLGIGLLAGLLLLARWLSTADPRMLAWVMRVLIGVLVIGALALVALSGRYIWIAYALPFLLPIYFQWRSKRIRARNATGPTPGRTSDATTTYLHMSLDHDSGDMTGTVTAGNYAGRDLSSMELAEMLDLLKECSGDADSVRVLEAYLDRVHGPEWRSGEAGTEHDGQGRNGSKSTWGNAMTPDEAWEILGLEPGAGPDSIKEAHRRLMGTLHPDHGGSTYLAAKLNQAKDLLLSD
jgi:hypothetical protein